MRTCRYLLPPIIFYAGLSVKKKQFFRNFATIASFGIFGTYVAFALIALVLYGLAQLPNVLNLSVSPLHISWGTGNRRPGPGSRRMCTLIGFACALGMQRWAGCRLGDARHARGLRLLLFSCRLDSTCC